MSECSFCGASQETHYPLCHACGSIRYPIEKIKSQASPTLDKKIKLTASIAAALVVPGAFLLLAYMGANHLSRKIKKPKP